MVWLQVAIHIAPRGTNEGLHLVGERYQCMTDNRYSTIRTAEPSVSPSLILFLLRRNWLAWYECLITLTSSSQWPPVSTQILPTHIVEGYSINAPRLTGTCQYIQEHSEPQNGKELAKRKSTALASFQRLAEEKPREMGKTQTQNIWSGNCAQDRNGLSQENLELPKASSL